MRLPVTWLTPVVGQRPEPKLPVWALPSSHILRVPVLGPKGPTLGPTLQALPFQAQGRPEGNVGQTLTEEGRPYGEHSSKGGVFMLCAEALLWPLLRLAESGRTPLQQGL